MYGDSRWNPVAALPTGESMNPAAPVRAPYYDPELTAYVMFKVSDVRSRPTRVFTSHGLIEGWKIGTRVHMQHDQTRAWMGEYEVVGIYDFASGEKVGSIPDYKIRHCVAK